MDALGPCGEARPQTRVRRSGPRPERPLLDLSDFKDSTGGSQRRNPDRPRGALIPSSGDVGASSLYEPGLRPLEK